MGRLSGKRAIVTGAASGIGRASAQLFAREGADVLVADLSPKVEETAQAIIEAGGKSVAVTADAGDENDVQGLVRRCIDEFGGLEVFYANAGILESLENQLLEQSVEDWQRVLRVNLLGPFLAVKHAAPHMISQGGGAIVMTASVAGMRANAGAAAYSASKAGVISLVQTAATALGGTGVRVNAVCPGLIETGMTETIFDFARNRGSEHKIGQLNPMQRAGAPSEIAQMAAFLASDDASYVNGQAIPVDGGLTATHPFVPPRR
jgi:NAD(P)-dependent dehydrogenase (short-subunit alcohol dehydrogenase family)